MEKQSEFSLNQAIRQWREHASAPALRGEDLDELEGHLRDCMTALQSQGLAEEEAFWLASRRMGTAEELNYEFGKVNRKEVWLNHALWMLAGYLIIGCVWNAGNVFSGVALAAAHWLIGQQPLPGPLYSLFHAAVLLTLFYIAWEVGRSFGGKVGAWAKTHAVRTAVGAMVISVLLSAAGAGTNWVMAKVIPVQAFGTLVLWRMPAGFLVSLSLLGVLVWLLVRRGERRAQPRGLPA